MFSSKSSFTMKYAPLQQQESTDYTSAFTYGTGSKDAPIKTKPRDWIFNKQPQTLAQFSTDHLKLPTPLSLKLLNWLLHLVSFFLCLVTVPFSLLATLKMARQYERIIVFRLGRLSGIKGPGIVTVLPCIDKWSRVDLRTKAFHIPPTNLSTKDGGVISVGAMVYFRIADPVKMSLSVSDINKSVRHVSQSCMSNLLCKKTYDVIMNKRLNLSYDLQVDINLAANDWGAEVSSVELSDINLLVKPRQQGASQQGANPMFGGNQLFSSFANIAQQVMSHVNDDHQQVSNVTPTISLDQLLVSIQSSLSIDLVHKVGVVYLFVITDQVNNENQTQRFVLDLKNGSGSISKISESDVHVITDVEVCVSTKTLNDIITKEVSMFSAYSCGDLKVSGSLSDAAKLSHLSEILEGR